MTRRVNVRVAAVASALMALSAAQTAAGEEPVETALKAWVATIDVSPDWRATYQTITVDPTTGKAILAGLSVQGENPGFGVDVQTIAVDGFRETLDGSFAAREVDIDGLRVEMGFVALAVSKAQLNAFILPQVAGFVWDEARPFVSMVKALAPLATVRAASATVGSIVLEEVLDNVKSRVSYDQIKIDGWGDGKIAAIGAGPIKNVSPSSDPLVTMTVDTVATRAVDLDAMLAVFDPDRYASGAGDGIWHSVIGRADYHGFTATVPGVSATIADVSVENFKLRQPNGGSPLLGLKQNSDPVSPAAELLQRFEMLSAYGVGKFAMNDIDFTAAGIDRMHFGGLSFADVSTEAIGELAIDDMEGAITGQGSVKLGRFAFGGLILPPMDAVVTAFNAHAVGGDVDYSSLIPAIGFVEAADVDIALNATPRTQLGRFRLDLGRYVGQVPTTIALDLADADMDAALVPNAKLRILLDEFGYDRARIDAGFKVDWSETGDIAVKEFHLAMKDLGALSGDLDLAGLTPANAQNVHTADDALARLSLKRAALTFKDDSIVMRGIAAQADRLKIDPDKFRQQFAMGLPFMLTFLGNIDLQKQLTPVLQTFVRTPGSITAVAAPNAPVALAALAQAATTAPFTVFGMLSLNVSGVAGPAPPATTPAPTPPGDEIRKSIGPAK